MSIAHTWNTTTEERDCGYACDDILGRDGAVLFRAITIDAPANIVFRWLCQLRAAPYSYDWIDNFGRKSPQELTPGLEHLAVGQRMMTVFDLVSFERDRQITLRLRPRRLSRLIFGDVVATYLVIEEGGGTRLIAKLVLRYPPPPIGWLMRVVLPWGDLVMMRKQFLNLKRLCERDAKSRRPSTGSPPIND